MGSIYHGRITVSIFGQSHSEGIGVVIDGLPAGKEIDLSLLSAFLKHRAPGNSPLSTARTEDDEPEFLSGLYKGKTCGAPLCAVLKNRDTRSSDYEGMPLRPGHADYSAWVKYKGAADFRGGGHFSGRLTAPLCVAGGICLQLLEKEGITAASQILSVGKVTGTHIDPVGVSRETLRSLAEMEFPALQNGEAMQREILSAGANGDSVGGVIECAVCGVPAGLGDPMFDGMENRISRLVFAIPAMRGIEFGAGFSASGLLGSEHNDSFYRNEAGEIRTETNRHGGILGGITTGMPLVFSCAVKPTPSIAKEQKSVEMPGGESRLFRVKGRHDPCIVPRAVPCVTAAAAIALYDAWLEEKEKN